MLERMRRAIARWREGARIREATVAAPTEGGEQDTHERAVRAARPGTDEEVFVSGITGRGQSTEQERQEATETAAVSDESRGVDPELEGEEASDFEELTPEERLDLLDQEAEIAADFVEGLLDQLGLPGDIEIVVREEQATINVSEVGTGLLIGRRGATLDALQELVRCATQRRTERRSHVRVDVEGYRERQLDKLRDKCRDAIALARETGEPQRLEPMDAYERKMMHDVVAKAGGVTSTSEGAEPRRRVVIHPVDE